MDMLNTPNNILGLEYTRAILERNAQIDILPIRRVGSGYKDLELHDKFSSASAIRRCINSGKDFSDNVPEYVKNDLPNTLEDKLDALEKYAVLSRTASEIAKVCDCREGLENAFKKAALQSISLSESLTSPRYTASRIRRIALQTLLNIDESTIRESIQNGLYLRILGVKRDRSELLSALSKAKLPILIRAHDEDQLSNTAKKAYVIDQFAEQVYSLLYRPTFDKNVFI